MVSSISFKMRQIMFVLIMLICFSTSNQVVNNVVPKSVLDECVDKECTSIDHANKCTKMGHMGDDECTFDISKFSQDDVTKLFAKMVMLSVWLKCDGSTLSDIDLSKMTTIGMTIISPENSKRMDSHETFTITNNLYLRRIILPDMKYISPGFFTVRNNPRLSRLSIDNMRRHLLDQSVSLITGEDEAKIKTLIGNEAKISDHGACDYYVDPANPSNKKTSLSWLEFRWCRTIDHDVILEGTGIKSGSDPAYILNVNGRLTIKNTTITDLSILPVYFRSKGGEISGNKDLCISFADEIRMKRLDFKMENNKDLSCRTTCDIGEVTVETIKKLKNCVTLNGGLILDGIDAATAGADFFKTIRVINGPVVITNSKVTVDFKELKEIKLAGENSPHISLTNCTLPILFPNLTTLDGTGASPMVVLNNSRIDIFNFLNRTYTGKIKDLSRERILETTTASGNIDSSVSALVSKRSSTGTVTRGISVTAQPSNAPVGQPDAPMPIDINSAEKPETTNTKISTSPTGETDAGDVKNSNLPSQRDPNNSAVEGKSNVLMAMTIVSLVVFLASSATSVGIVIKYRVM